MTSNRNRKHKQISISTKNILHVMGKLKDDRKVQRNARHLPGRDRNGSRKKKMKLEKKV